MMKQGNEIVDNEADTKDELMATVLGRRAELEKLMKEEGKWTFYRVLCQFRFGYFFFLVMMVILMFSFSFLMEIFFAIFLPSARADPDFTTRSIILLAILPFALILLSYLFEESTRVFFDALDKTQGSLSTFRLSLCVVIHYLRHKNEMPLDRLHTEYVKKYAVDEDQAAWNRLFKPCANIFTALFAPDPFDDQGKEDEDKKREELEMEFQQSKEKAMTGAIQRAQKSSDHTPRERWKKAFRVAKTAAIFGTTSFDGPPLDFSTLVIVDFICPIFFEFITLYRFFKLLVLQLSPMDAFLAYIEAGFYTCLFYLGLWMVTHFWSSRNQKMREFVSNYRRRYREMERKLNEIENERKSQNLWLVDIGFRGVEFCQSTFFTCFGAICGDGKNSKHQHNSERTPLKTDPPKSYTEADSDANETKEAIEGENRLDDIVDEIRSWNPWAKFSYRRKMQILLPLTLASAVISFQAFYLGWTIMGFCLVITGNTIQQRFPQIFGGAFRAFITTFVILSFVFFSSSWAVGTFVIGGDFKIYPPLKEVANESFDFHVEPSLASGPAAMDGNFFGQVAKYPVCSLDLRTMSIIDFGLIADAIYGINTSIQTMSLGERFNGTELGDWKYVTRNNETIGSQVWAELFFPSINMTVIAVRGTASATDALEDLHYWFGVTIMQAANVFLPFLNQLPQDFVVTMLSMDILSRVMPPPIYDELLNHVVKVRQRVGGKNLVLTGHSLGGAMAAMVGAKTKTPAVSFSGPGLLYSRGRFHVDAQDIRDYVLTIKPRLDIVPRVDLLGGMIQEIECRLTNPLGCHSTITHLCELHASCGDSRNRDWSHAEQCDAYFESLLETHIASPFNS